MLALSLISSTAMATGTLTQIEQGEVELLLAESASKLLYLERDCNKPIDNEKFEELAKIKAFSEGYESIEGISWSRIEVQSQHGYEKQIMGALGHKLNFYKTLRILFV